MISNHNEMGNSLLSRNLRIEAHMSRQSNHNVGLGNGHEMEAMSMPAP